MFPQGHLSGSSPMNSQTLGQTIRVQALFQRNLIFYNWRTTLIIVCFLSAPPFGLKQVYS